MRSTRLCGAELICPECQEPVRDLPPTDIQPGRFDRPEVSHHDESTLCPVFGNDPGSNRGGERPARPVAFLPARVLQRP